MIKYYLVFLCTLCCFVANAQNNATIEEFDQTYTTYPFSDPDPIPNPARNYYPYFRYSGFTLESVEQDWKVVSLENDYIKVFILPEIGGKIWGAIEKSTGREFIYYNSVVKFRDIAMRGPWTSGGIEFNFGIIGHVPTTSNPVDYLTKENSDGSVSCIVGANELMTRARWEVEIRLPKDKAWFSTTTTYHNTTPLIQPYYQWHNAAFQAAEDLEYCFPGDISLGHGGEASSWPIDKEGRNLSWYKNNAFGGAKSDMIMGSTKGYFAAYWHDNDFGSGHYAAYGDKSGRKIFTWSQSRSGGIWEDLLTDDDGQYVEMQSGKSLNQAGSNSMLTPFKHAGFAPYQTDVFTEYWFPILSTSGVAEANNFGVLNVTKNAKSYTVSYCPLEISKDDVKVYMGDKLIESYKVNLSPLETWTTTFSVSDNSQEIKIIVGDKKLHYSEKPENLKRPVEIPKEFDWKSINGLYTEGVNWMYQNEHGKALSKFEECLQIDPLYAPAMNQIAELYYRKGKNKEALRVAQKALSLDTYDPKANFIYGLINKELGNWEDALDGFSLATFSTNYRNSAYLELAKLYMLDKDWLNASLFANKAFKNDPANSEAIQALAVINRKTGNIKAANECLTQIESSTPLNHFIRFERMLLEKTEASQQYFTSMIKNELPNESFMELASWYENSGLIEETIQLLEIAPGNTMIYFKLAYLYNSSNQLQKKETVFSRAITTSPDLVFPFRKESIAPLEWAGEQSDNWHAKYLLGVLHWSLGNIDEAKSLFNECGNNPDRFYFYAAKPNLFGEDAGYDSKADLLRAIDLKPVEWRTSKMLIDYYLDKEETKEALDVANKALRDFPSNYEVRYTVAKCLLANNQYDPCLEVLEGSNILPNEGASRGRVIYRQANLMKAIEYYKEKNCELALQYIEKARLWPENLGVGRPYNPDERIEDFLEAQCLKNTKNNESQINNLFEKIISYSENKSLGYTSSDYIYLLTLRLMGNEAKMNDFISKWKNAGSNNFVLQWSEYMLNNDFSAARKVESTIDTAIEGGTPWNPKHTDPIFELVKSLNNALK